MVILFAVALLHIFVNIEEHCLQSQFAVLCFIEVPAVVMHQVLVHATIADPSEAFMKMMICCIAGNLTMNELY